MTEMIAVAIVDLKAGPALDWAVAKAVGVPVDLSHSPFDSRAWPTYAGTMNCYRPSTDWAQGGPLIDEFDVWIAGPIDHGQKTQAASVGIDGLSREGVTKLEAVMKAIVAHKFGDAVQVPRELWSGK